MYINIIPYFMNKESSVKEYGGSWKQTTSEVIRHRNFLQYYFIVTSLPGPPGLTGP